MVAEGVESGTAPVELARLGRDVAQGYYFSKPVPADELTSWLQDRSQQPPTYSPSARVASTPN